MQPVLHTHLPEDMRQGRSLPGVQPVIGPWLRVDEAYAGQMALRSALMKERPEEVLWSDPDALQAGRELLDMVLDALPALGFEVGADVQCPDGRKVRVSRTEPFKMLGQLVQCDFCVLTKVGDEHVLKGAILCFPASWRLDEKAGQPLTAIHSPVDENTNDLGRRVQRMFDAVKPGRALWRFNQLWYDDPALFQPRSQSSPRPVGAGWGQYLRSERQTILRLPKTGAVVFAIHTYVLSSGTADRALPR